MKKLPFISVIVCCYNDAKMLPACLRALQKQRWEGKLEIVVVDDGSSDDSCSVAQSFGVRLIRNKQNAGPAVARNTGIRAAKGGIIAFTDADCRPRPAWLKELYAQYTDADVVGVGGKTIPHSAKKLLFRFLSLNNPLDPLELSVQQKRSPLTRLASYIKGVLGISSLKNDRARSVYSMPSANLSFRASALRKVGGFDESFTFSGEDQDLCRRINQRYPNSLRYAPKASVLHEYKDSLRDTLRRCRAYGKGSALFSIKHPDVKPVIFPFPPLIIGSAAVLGLIHPLLVVLPALLIPLVYLRWLKLSLTTCLMEPLAYAYIQFLQECYGNIGFVQGKWQSFQQRNSTLAMHVQQNSGYIAIAALICGFNLLELTKSPLQLAVAIIASLFLPGWLLLRILHIKTRTLSGFLYAIITSVALLICLSLTLNTFVSLYPTVLHLNTGLFVLGLDLLVLPLLLAAWRMSPGLQAHLPRFTWKIGYIFLAGLLPIFSVFGANLLNNTGQNWLSMTVLTMVAISLLIGGIVLSKRLGIRSTALLLYVSGLSIILLGSMRGNFVSGTDISKEWYLLNLMQKAGHWSPSLYSDAYNGCLSINLLPTFLARTLRISNEMVFRVIVPIVYALVPITIYKLCQRWSNKSIALLTALFTIAQPAFVTWSPIPIRQMFGIFFFSALILAAFDKKIPARARRLLLMVFGVAMILSHYSTSYLGIGLLILSYGMELLVHFVLRRSQPLKHLVSLPVILVLCLSAVIWYGPITGTGKNITDRTEKTWHSISQGNINPFRSNGYAEQAGLGYQLGLQQSTDVKDLWNDYLKQTNSKYRGTGITAISSQPPTITIRPDSPKKAPAKVSPIILNATLVFDKLIRQLARLFLILGLAYFVWRSIRSHRASSKHLFSLAAGIVLLLVIVVPYASIDYDVGRTSQQLLILLAFPTVMGAKLAVKAATRSRINNLANERVVGVLFIAMLLFTSGWITQITGGIEPNMMLNNSGNQYDQLYIHTSEATAANWLRHNKEDDIPVYGGYFSGTRFYTAGMERPVFYDDILPWTISRQSYVYSGYAETMTDQATTYYKGTFINYEYPADSLSKAKGTIYSNGSVKVYK